MSRRLFLCLQFLACYLVVGLNHRSSPNTISPSRFDRIAASPLVFEEGAVLEPPEEEFYSYDPSRFEFVELHADASDAPHKDVTEATATVPATAGASVIPKPYKKRVGPPAPDALKLECPRADCPKKGSCAFNGGICCGDKRTCCPAGFLCVPPSPGSPSTTCQREDNKENRCMLQKCKEGHECPHRDVKHCCPGGVSCCAKEYECSLKGKCNLKKEYSRKQNDGHDDDTTELTPEVQQDKELMSVLKKAKELKKQNDQWLAQETQDKLASARAKTHEEFAQKKAKRDKMTPDEKKKYELEREKALSQGIIYELNDDRGSHTAIPLSKNREQALNLTAGASFIGGALRIACPNKIGARAHSSDYHDAWDVGNKDFSIVARFMTTVEGPLKRVVTKRGKEVDTSGYGLYVNNGSIVFQIGRNNSITGTSRVNDGEWHTVIGVRDTENTQLRLYVDALLQKKGDDISSSLSNDGQFQLGGFYDSAPAGENFCGLIKDVGLFLRVLNPEEILKITNDPDSAISMARIRNEELLNQAAAAAKEAEDTVGKSKKAKETLEKKSEATVKYKDQKALAKKAAKEAFDALSAQNKLQQKLTDAEVEMRSAPNADARDRALWKASTLKEQLALAQAAYLQSAKESDLQNEKEITLQEDETKSTASELVTKAKEAEHRSKMLKTAEAAEKTAEKANCHLNPNQMKLMARWSFDGNLRDSVGAMHGTAQGGTIAFENGGAVVEKGHWIRTDAITQTLKEKTLEVWLRLDGGLAQGGDDGAGVMGLQNKQAITWDTITYNLKNSKRWVSASNGGERTDDSKGGAEVQTKEPIHIAVVHASGSITIYRNGKAYRDAYSKGAAVEYTKDNAEVIFGIVHGNNTGTGHFKGTLLEARLYSKALTDAEVASSYFSYMQCPSLLKAMTEDKKKTLEAEKTAAETKLIAEKAVQTAKAEDKTKKHSIEQIKHRAQLRAEAVENEKRNAIKKEEQDTRNLLKARKRMCLKAAGPVSPNAGKFSWPVFKYNKETNFVNHWAFSSRATLVGDINGDGRDDYMRLGATKAYLFISKGDGNYWEPIYHFPSSKDPKTGQETKWNFLHDENKWTTIPAIDLNGDKRLDFVRVHYQQSFAFISQGENLECWYKNGDIPVSCFRVANFNFPSYLKFNGKLTFNHIRRTVSGDFNGDGRGDFARVAPSAIYFFISKGDGTFYTPHFAFPKGLNIGDEEGSYRTLVGNFNGNCQTSFLFAKAKLAFSLLNQGTEMNCWFRNGWIKAGCFKLAQFTYPSKYNFRGIWNLNTRATITGDFNGDGMTDFARMGDKRMFLFINKGAGQFHTPIYNFPPKWDFTMNEHIWSTIPGADFDGDAKTDIIRTYYTYHHGFYPRGKDAQCWNKDDVIPLNCFLITTFYYPAGWRFTGDWAFYRVYSPLLGDFNGDGKDDFINAGGGTFNHQFIAL